MRLSKDECFLGMAWLLALRGTCARRQVGCVLTDIRWHVLATGYNGPASKEPHCSEEACPGALLPSGTGLDKCEAIHAEQNALLQCRDVYDIRRCYSTTAPCLHCVKLLLNTGCHEIIFFQDYPHTEESKRLWERASRTWLHLEPPSLSYGSLSQPGSRLIQANGQTFEGAPASALTSKPKTPG